MITFSCFTFFQLREKVTLRIKQATEVKAIQFFIYTERIFYGYLLTFNNKTNIPALANIVIAEKVTFVYSILININVSNLIYTSPFWTIVVYASKNCNDVIRKLNLDT